MSPSRRALVAAVSSCALVLALTVGAAEATANPGTGQASAGATPQATTPSPSTTTSTTPTVSSSPSPTPTGYAIHLVIPVRVLAMRTYSLGGSVLPGTPMATRVDLQVWSQAKHAWTHSRNGATTASTTGAAVTWSAGKWTPTAPTRYSFRAVVVVAGRAYISNVVTVTILAVLDPVVSGPLTAAAVPFSYRAGCPVGPSSLRKITLDYWTFTGRVERGSIVVARSAVPAIEYLFANALAKRFPIRRIVPTDYFYDNGRYSPTLSDERAMQEDDTSAFNCRTVTGDPYRISQHSYGNAVDVNTRENPYVTGHHFYPSNGRTYLNRKNIRPGMITRSSVVYRAMARYHWLWGGRWAHPDYQHFSSNGG